MTFTLSVLDKTTHTQTDTTSSDSLVNEQLNTLTPIVDTRVQP